jgi:exonuclease VII small subunit
MFGFFRTWLRGTAKPGYRDSDEIFQRTQQALARCRQQMSLLYEELELAMQMADAYAVRLDKARTRVHEIVEQRQPPQRFSSERRQRA